MELKLTIGDTIQDSSTQLIDNNAKLQQNKQTVRFAHILDKIGMINKTETQSLPNALTLVNDNENKGYTGTDSVIALYGEDGIVFLNYTTGGRIETAEQRKFGISTVPSTEYLGGVSVYRKEIWYTQDDHGNIIAHEEPKYHIVTDNTDAGIVYDYNIGNNRYYKYLYRFVYNDGANTGGDKSIYQVIGLREVVAPMEVKWNGWTISELHEVSGSNGTKFTTSLKDTWKFKFNISSGQQAQNLSRTQQDTLGVYPRFSQGLKNAISGSVQCLLGRDFAPAQYSTNKYVYTKKIDPESKNIINWEWSQNHSGKIRNLGGYKEELYNSVSYSDQTSNSSLDLLDKWRELCYSGNPKLLRDAKGQRFIVQIYDTSNTTQETWNRRPEEISFNWIQINDADNVKVVEEV